MSNSMPRFVTMRKRFVLCLMLCIFMIAALEQEGSLYKMCNASPTKHTNTYRTIHESEPRYRAHKSEYTKSNLQNFNKQYIEIDDDNKKDRHSAQEWTVHTSCPSCPMCDRSGTSFGNSLRYCNKLTSSVRQFWKSMQTLHPSTHDIYTDELPFTRDKHIRKQALEHIRELLETQLVGQPHVIDPLVQLMRHKMFSPNEPLVIHLAGDNGVGKTFTARLVSLALSLHCTSHTSFAHHLPSLLLEQRCESGDALLTIAGSGFDGMPLREARARVVQQVIHHMNQHPHGIVLIDDLTVMNPELVKALAPLFGRDAYFPEQFAIEPGPWDEMYYSEEHDKEKEEHERKEKESDVQHKANYAEHTTVKMMDIHNSENGTTNTYHHDYNSDSNSETKDNKQLSGKMSSVWSSLSSTYNTLSNSTRPHRFKSRQKSLHSSPRPSPLQSLSQLTVFITTDFGQQGRTMNKTIDEIHELVRSEFKEVYGKLLPAHMRTFVYAPFSFRTALEMIVSAVRYLPCKFYKSSTMLYSADIELSAAHFLVQRYRSVWEGSENGHALRRIVEDELIAQLMEYWERDDDEFYENEVDVNYYCEKRSYSEIENWELNEEESVKCSDMESDKNKMGNVRNSFAPLHAHFVLDEQSARVVLQLSTLDLPFSKDL